MDTLIVEHGIIRFACTGAPSNCCGTAVTGHPILATDKQFDRHTLHAVIAVLEGLRKATTHAWRKLVKKLVLLECQCGILQHDSNCLIHHPKLKCHEPC